jgi:hypothetical protein
MCDHAGANHIQIHVNQTSQQVLSGLDGGCMVPVFPECAFTTFPVVILLGSSAGNQFNRLRNNRAVAIVLNDEVNMIRCHQIVQYDQTETPSCFKKPMNPAMVYLA